MRDVVPGELIVFVCDRCGRKEFSSFAIRPGHYSGGERCGGVVRKCLYIWTADAPASKDIHQTEGE